MLIKVTKLLDISEQLSECVSANLSNNFDVITLQTADGGLYICELTGTSRLTARVVCRDASWHKLQEETSLVWGSTLLVGSTAGVWNVYRCYLPTVTSKDLDITLQYTWDATSLSLLKYAWFSILDTDEISDDDFEILSFRCNRVILCLQNQVICSVDAYQDRSLDNRSIFRINEENEPVRSVRLADKHVCTLDSRGSSISLYDIEKGLKMVCLQLNQLCIPEASNVYISYSSARVLVVDRSDNLYSLKIPRESQKTEKIRKPSLVTAFSKQLSSKSGKSQSAETLLCHKLHVKGHLCQAIVEDTCAFLCLQNNQIETTFHVINFENGLELKEQLVDKKAFLVKPVGLCCPPLIVSRNCLFLPSIGLPATEFVKKLMLLSSGSLAEYLSHLNEWLDVTLDKDILVMGIRNRQLDTIAFYLAQKISEFCKSWNSSKNEIVDNWVDMLKLIQDALTDSANDNASLHFSEQLLQITLKTLVDLLAFCISKESGMQDGTSMSFTNFLVIFRSLLKGNKNDFPAQQISSRLTFSNDLCEKWALMDKEAIMDAAAIEGCVPLAQWFLSQQFPSEHLSLEHFQERARPLAHHALCQGNLKTALATVSNTGLPADEIFQELFESTTMSDVRNILASCLERKSLLLPDDRKDLEYLVILEQLYPCTSFTTARQHALDNRPDVDGVPPMPPMDLLPTTDLVHSPIENQNLEFFRYGQFSLTWVRQWSSRIRQMVLVPALLRGENIPRDFCPSKEIVWECLLERGDTEHLQHWVSSFVEPQKIEEQEKKFPFDWSIDDAMINKLTEVATPQHVREFLLNDLAKHGVFCHEELEDIQNLLCRLGSAGVLVNGPHIPIQRRNQGSILSIRQSDYNHRLIHFCLKNHLSNLLYYFIRNNRSALQFSDCAWCRVPLVTSAQIFCQWENTPQDPGLCFQSILSCAQMVYSLREANIPLLCQEKDVPSFLVAAALLYCPQPIRTALMSSPKDKELLEKALDEVPFMRSALSLSICQNQQDVNVYNLLLDNCVFDPRRLFGWQNTNTIKTEEAPSEVPHFSHEFWAQQYGLSQSLDTSYFLLEGRPNNAYLKFMAKELSTLKKIDPRRVQKACLDACVLALRHYTSPKVGSSCVMFLELLGQDSFYLRMHLQLAIALHPDFMDTPSAENVNLLESALKDPLSAQEAGEVLDDVCCRNWNQPGGQTSALPLCFLLVAFCHYYQLNIIPGFLKLVAKSSDWLSLLSFSQALNIPLDQVLNLLHEVPDECLANHLTSALQGYTVQSKIVKPKVTRESKDMRIMLYTRMGLLKTEKDPRPIKSFTKQVEEDQYSLSSDDGNYSDSSSIKETSEVILHPRDLIEQLLSACNTSSPGTTLLDAGITNSNPYLCLIAASLTETVTLYQCFCCWLVSSLEDPSSVLMPELISSAKSWSLGDLSLVFTLFINHSLFKLLEKAFWLFDPYSSLFRLTDFLHSFWVKKEYRESNELLEKFEAIQATSPVGKIGGLEWVVTTCISMIKAALVSSSNAFEQKLFLEILSQARLNEIFSDVEGIANFGHLHQLLECVPVVDMGKVELPIAGLVDNNVAVVDQAVLNLVSQLQSLGKIKEAKRLGQLAEIPSSVVLLSQLTEEATALQTTDIDRRLDFWNSCNELLKLEEGIQDQALCFFKNWSGKAFSVKERYMILALVNEWFAEISEEQEEWEQEMWRSCVDCQIEKQKENPSEVPFIYQTHKSGDWQWESWQLNMSNQNTSVRKPIRKAVEQITSMLLEQGRIGDAWKIARIHHFFTIDLTALVICLKLARKQISGNEISQDFWNSFLEKNCTSEAEKTKSEINDLNNMNEKNILILLEKVCSLTNCGKQIAYKILNHYKVCLLLQCSYLDVACEPTPLDLLDRVLNSECPEKYAVAKEVITVHHIPDQQILAYLFQRITSALTDAHSPLPSLSEYRFRSRSISMSSLATESSVSFQFSFQLLLRLCQDPAQLGNKLLRTIQTMETKTDDLAWKVSVCVYSHDCFTACMHMEGISKLLRQAHELTLQLAEAKAFHLMIQLLTGIGRYSEMTYIFDLLRENAQFELLLKKGMEELPMLRLALLDYLKKHHVSDREIHSMLALKFKMFREIAEMLENASQEKVNKLAPNNQDVKDIRHELEIIMQDYEAAAKSYIESNCLLKAQSCARQAKLVAVQLSFISTPGGAWVLSLDQEAAQKFVTYHKHFLQAYVVCEAYDLSSSCTTDPWEQALQIHVLEHGDWDYLENFKFHLGLTDARIQSLAQRFCSGSSREVQNRMQRLLNQCRDVTMRYQLADQLGFDDMCKDLLQSDTTGAYLKDTLQGIS